MIPVRRAAVRTLPALLCVLAAASPAAAQPADGGGNPDPFERFNRKMFALNQVIYAHVLRPASKVWTRVVPAPFRAGLRNAYSNLGEPVVMINDVLQGRFHDAASSFGRFALNSTAGVAGLVDYAGREGLQHHDNSFGTTLGRYGVKPGPYIYLPVLGPSDVRDGVGSGVDIVMNPQTWINYGARPAAGTAEGISGGLNAFADADPQLRSLEATSTDLYATLRSLYLQNRAAQIRGQAVDVNALPDFDDPAAKTSPAAPGSVGPFGGDRALKRPGVAVPIGDAAALPQAGPPSSGPNPDASTPAPPPPPPSSPGAVGGED